MAKLNSGIIAGLALGVGAYILARTASGKKPNELKCKPNQHIERHNGIDVCVDDDKPITCDVGSHLENGICVKNFSCPPNFHAENGICVPDLVCPKECTTGYHVENCKCVKDQEPLKPVISSFNYSPNNGVDLVNVNFNLKVGSTRSQINWDFGDGSPIVSGQTNPKHKFYTSSSGSVTVITQDGRSEEKTFSITVTKRGDIPSDTKGKITNVSLSPKEGIAPLTVNASVSGTRKIQSAYWDFDNEYGITQGSSKGTTYNKAGTYNGEVKVIFDNGDEDIETFTVVANLPTFTSKIKFWDTGAKVGKTIIFGTSGSGASGSIKYKWNFGDGKVETVTDITRVHHVYTYADKFKVSLISTTLSGQSDNDEIFITVKREDPFTPPPIQCNTGFHLENGICVRDEVDPPTPPVEDTQIFKGIVARSGRIEKHPTAFSSTYLLANYPLPSKVKKIKYARIYFNAKADSFGLNGAKAVIKFNGSVVGTVNWKAFEDGKSIKLDPIVVTNKMKKTGYNKLEVTYTHNNNLFGQPLSSGFIVNGSDLYVEYEY